MITCENGQALSRSVIYQAFASGFSDYIVKFNMSEEEFFTRFFGPEGNGFEYSFAALDGDKPIGVILGGLKCYEGIKTLRCGALAVDPGYRGSEVAQKLFSLHKDTARQNGCRRLWLEVIVGNDRAVRFYEKLGYETMYLLSYYSFHDAKRLLSDNRGMNGIHISPIGLDEFSSIYTQCAGTHINWQNDLDYIKKSENLYSYQAVANGKPVGGICLSKTGRIHFIWVEKEWRCRSVGTLLLQAGIRDLQLADLSASSSNNSLLAGFLKKTGFTKEPRQQYEMQYIL